MFLKRFFSLFFLFVIANYSFGQILDPVKWSHKVIVKPNGEAEIQFIAKLDPHWHIYSQKEVPDGPIPTYFSFEKNDSYVLVGTPSEPKGKIDKMWEDLGVKNVICFEGTVYFKQKIKLKSTKKFKIHVDASYMVCDKACQPGDKSFDIEVDPGGTEISNDPVPAIDTATKKTDTTQTVKPTGNGLAPVGWRFVARKFSPTEFELSIKAKIDTGWVLFSSRNSGAELPIPTRIAFELPKGVSILGELKESTPIKKVYKLYNRELGYFEYVAEFKQRFKTDKVDSLLMKDIKVRIDYMASNGKETVTLTEQFKESVDMSKAPLEMDPDLTDSYWFIFITAFLSGFVALIMPCIFPMIPMTVSFFLKRSKNRKKGIANAIVYGISIIVIYVALGLIVTAIFGSDSLNALATNVWFNLFFFAMLVVFAFSFLGAFEIRLPSSWVNAADKGADKGGMLGIFFMAFTLALVSFSCTGPIVGTLLVEAAQKGGWGPFWGMFGFSLAIALPFAIFAIFPSLLNSMPQSGGWLNTVKVSLGFLELAFSFKFLSNADLVVQAHLLERELFIAIWIAIFALWGLYLLGKYKLSHDSDVTYLSTGRITTAILIFSFVIYLIPGMWGAPLKWISGFPPPINYSESPYGVGNSAPEGAGKKKLPDHAQRGPHGLIVFHDYEHALEYAREIKKPLLIDFTGWACVNCRQMEERVWSVDEVKVLMRDSLVIASLYVDEKTMLPESEQYVSSFDGKKIKTIGNKWSDFQKTKYMSSSQPQYFILDQFGETMNGSANYQDHGNPEVFRKWLETGIKRYEENKNGKEYRPAMIKASGMPELPETAKAEKGPHDIPVYFDYVTAKNVAQQLNKPLLVYFTGWAGVNCRRLEDQVWKDGTVKGMLSNEVVIATLYVDDKKSLPENEKYTSALDGKKVSDYGSKWSDLQRTKFKSNMQPELYLLDENENILNGSANYQHQGEVIAFSNWLAEGISKFKG